MLIASLQVTIKRNKEIIMLTFLLVLVLVFIAVDLFVRFVIDPLASGSNKNKKVIKIIHIKIRSDI